MWNMKTSSEDSLLSSVNIITIDKIFHVCLEIVTSVSYKYLSNTCNCKFCELYVVDLNHLLIDDQCHFCNLLVTMIPKQTLIFEFDKKLTEIFEV